MQKTKIANIVYIIEWIALGILAVLAVFRIYDNSFLLEYQSYNRILAQTAAYTFIIAVLPGSLIRLKILPKLVGKLIFWRRALGILMYIFAFAHFTLVIDLTPLLSQYGALVSPLTITGIISLLILAPVTITSTNWAQKLLKKYWKTIQRLTYVAIIFLAIHFIQTDHLLLASFYFALFLIIIFSYIYPKFHGRTKTENYPKNRT